MFSHGVKVLSSFQFNIDFEPAYGIAICTHSMFLDLMFFSAERHCVSPLETEASALLGSSCIDHLAGILGGNTLTSTS